MSLWKRMQAAADKVADARGGNDGHNLIDAAAELAAALHSDDEFKEALKRRGISARFEVIEPAKFS